MNGKVNKTALVVGLLIVVPLLVVFALSFGKDPRSIDSPLVGRAAPPFELIPVGGGQPVTLESLRGKPVVLNFWATWCEPCQQEHGVLQQAANILGKEVTFIGIVYDDETPRIQAFLTQHGSGYPALVDKAGRAAIAYGVAGVPETFFLDAGGRIVSKFSGPLDPMTLVQRVQQAMESR